MRATTQPQDKKRKQVIILGVLGCLLLGILAIQLPKLMGGGGSEAASTTDTVATTPATGGAAPVGVRFVPGVAPQPGEGQLASFSLFERRDPFVQLVKESAGGSLPDAGGDAGAIKVSGGAKPAASGQGGSTTSTGGGVTMSVPPSSPTGTVASSSDLASATIWVNGVEEAVDVKKPFPKADPTFVLVSLKPKVAQIAVAGGAFAGGKTIALRMGRTVTLVNTTTGARYTLKLLYTGTEPEQVQAFSQSQG